jgi:HTH-type transcriptional repressor of NAD biosynthesis genes
MKIAILGAECTGKTQLAKSLSEALADQRSGSSWVSEVLRDWCDAKGRTPLAHEQRAIAEAQASSIEKFGKDVWLVADTTPLMTAIYSDLLFHDMSLYQFALDHHRVYDLTLVTGLDLPWVADGTQRDGPKAQTMVDTRLREILHTNGLNYSMVYGSGRSRADSALQTIAHHRLAPGQRPQRPSSWKWACEKCSDADCEHRIFSGLVQADSVGV